MQKPTIADYVAGTRCASCTAFYDLETAMADGETPDLFLDDFNPGMTYRTPVKEISEADIIAFAETFDPQYYHIDPQAARSSAFGGLIASGLQTLCISFRQFFDLNLWPNAIIASPGMERLQWLGPLRPGDAIYSVIEVRDVRPSKSKPDRGIVLMNHAVWNQNGEMILSVDCMHMLRRRPR